MEKEKKDQIWKELMNSRTEALAKKVKEQHEYINELSSALEHHIHRTTALWEIIELQNNRIFQLENSSRQRKAWWPW